jgi:hypothetical protein
MAARFCVISLVASAVRWALTALAKIMPEAANSIPKSPIATKSSTMVNALLISKPSTLLNLLTAETAENAEIYFYLFFCGDNLVHRTAN